MSHSCPFFALSGLECLHRRLRNIFFSPNITQLNMPEDESHYAFTVRLVKVLHSTETAINQAVTEVIEQHVDLALELFLAPFVAIPWGDARGPSRTEHVSTPLIGYVCFLHSTVQRCEPRMSCYASIRVYMIMRVFPCGHGCCHVRTHR
jgi:hypothetical protein